MRTNRRITAAGLTCALAASLLLGNVEYATHTFAASKGIEKEESVYVTMDANGNQKKVIVSDWLKNSGINGKIEDMSSLDDIQNTKGNEKFTQDGEKLTWEAGENDIYYQGTTEEELPVAMEISYKLDGKEIAPKDLLGKSGKLEIKIQYINRSKKKVKVGNRTKEIYTPFLMATGFFMPVENFSNVKVDNGRVLSEGDNDIVAVYGMPGLKESLDLENIDFGSDSDIDTDKLNEKLTDSAVITADVTNFEMGQTYTVATPNLFSSLDFTEVKDANELDDKMDKLTNSANKLVNGSRKIKKGLGTLDNNFDKYEDGVKKIQKGAKSLDEGGKAINKATQQYTKGTDKILDAVAVYVDGTKTYAQSEKLYDQAAKKLVSGIGELYSAAKPFPKSYRQFHEKLTEYTSGVNELLSEKNMKGMTDGVSALKAGVSKINESAAQLNQSKDSVDAAIAGMEELIGKYKGLAAAETDPVEKATYEALVENLEKAVAGTKQYVTGAETFAAAVDAATNGEPDGALDSEGKADLAAGLGSLQEASGTMSAYAKKIREAKKPLLKGSGSIQSGIDSVVTNLKKASTGGQTLIKNNDKLKKGADKLIVNAGRLKRASKKITSNSDDFRNATKELSKGTSKLLSGLDTLTSKTGDVSKGIHKLADGSGTLFDGIKKFNRKGVNKLERALTDLIDGVEDVQDTTEAISQASKDYKSFSGISEKMDGNVKFVMTTDEIRDEDE